MKIIPFILVLFLLAPSEPEVVDSVSVHQIIDEDLFKRELQNSVLEFAEDANIHPDSVYIPFKDEL